LLDQLAGRYTGLDQGLCGAALGSRTQTYALRVPCTTPIMAAIRDFGGPELVRIRLVTRDTTTVRVTTCVMRSDPSVSQDYPSDAHIPPAADPQDGTSGAARPGQSADPDRTQTQTRIDDHGKLG
jgi:hypothetical protein